VSKQLKRKYKQARIEFKKELYAAAKENHALSMLMIQTYVASQHRTHIMKIWNLLGHHHPEAYKDYCDKLIGKHLTGRDDIWKSLHFAGQQELRQKYIRRIPETYAMGDALAIAYRVLKNA
jgi:hypothetical protein